MGRGEVQQMMADPATEGKVFSCPVWYRLPTPGTLSFRLYVNWRFMRGIEAQFLALQKGFNELIPQHLLKPFDQKELEVGAYWAEPSPQSRSRA